MPRPPKGYTPKKCKATKADGTPCKKWAERGYDYCKAHRRGQKTQFKSGPLNPNYKHGRYSGHLPTRMLANYEEALSDPDLVELRNAIALSEARINDLLDRVEHGESKALWQALLAAKYKFMAAPKAEKSKALKDLLAVIDEGVSESQRWADVLEMIDLRRRLTDSEGRRLSAMNQYVTVEKMQVFVVKLQMAIKEHVKDPAVLNAIANEFRKLQDVSN